MEQAVANRPKAVILLAFSLLVVLLTAVVVGYFVWFNWVTVYVDGYPYKSVTTASTVEEVLHELTIELRPEDYVYPPLDQPLSRRMGIVVIKAQPFVVNHDGGTTEVWSVGNKVADILRDAGVVYYAQDVVLPPAEASAQAIKPITVVRVESQIIEEEIVHPYATRHIPNYNMYRGQERVRHPGRDGVVINTLEIIYHDGEEVERQVIDSREVVAKRDREVEIGTISSISRGSYNINIQRIYDVMATAYCPGTPESGCPIDPVTGYSQCTGPYANYRTSTGRPAKEGAGTRSDPYIIAVDPRQVPLGSLVWLEFSGGRVVTGYGTIIRDGFAIAADVGSAIRGNRIDILFDYHKVAMSFGRRQVRVFLVESVENR